MWPPDIPCESPMSLLQNSSTEFFSRRWKGHRCHRRSSRSRLEGFEAEYLIDGEDEDAEHQMAFHLDRAAHTHEPAAEFILQSSVDAFDHGAEIIERIIRVGHRDRKSV